VGSIPIARSKGLTRLLIFQLAAELPNDLGELLDMGLEALEIGLVKGNVRVIAKGIPQGIHPAVDLEFVSDFAEQFAERRGLEGRWDKYADCRSDNSYIERFHRTLKEEEIWTAEYGSAEEARSSIARWIEEYNHDLPHCGVKN
jgi:integrase-like protein